MAIGQVIQLSGGPDNCRDDLYGLAVVYRKFSCTLYLCTNKKKPKEIKEGFSKVRVSEKWR